MPIHGNTFWFKKLPISEDDKNIFKKGSAGHMATQLVIHDEIPVFRQLTLFRTDKLSAGSRWQRP